MTRSRDEDVDYRVNTVRRGGGSPSAFWQKALLVLLTVGVMVLLALNVIQINQIGNLKEENRRIRSENTELKDKIKEQERQPSQQSPLK